MLFNLLEADANGGNPLGTILLFGGVIVLMVGFLIWSNISNKKKQKEAQAMVDSLKKGDRVKTIGGVCGFVVEINKEENTFVLETGTNDKKSYVKFDRGAIYQTAPAEGSAVAAQKAEKEEVKADERVEEKPAEKKPAKKTAKKAEKKEEKPAEEKAE
ncbi:MAG: preprotein translocase subunit YajC [Clostridia bacterium]|nr:preprotein translocase subunit YajC [Clostridia bacterium]